jgi:hypothetical protein
MKHWIFATSTAVAALMIGQAALADVTPEEVWQAWKDLGTSTGQTITVESEAREGDTLVLKNVTMAMDDADGGTMNGTIPEIRMTENGDGTVSMIMSETYTMTMKPKGIDGGPAPTINMVVTQKDMVITASGTADEMSYDSTVGQADIAIEATEEGGPAPVFTGNIGLTEAVGGYVLSGPADTKALESNVAAKKMTVVLDGADADAGSTFKMNMSIDDVTIDVAGMFISTEAMANMAQALKDGFSTDLAMSYGAMTMDVDVVEAGAPTKIVSTATGGGLDIAIGPDGLVYGANTKGLALTMAGGDIPFPELKLGFGEAGFNLVMPVMAGETSEEFEFLTKLVDFTISDEVWGMVDPTNQLPRDPATIIVDTKGTAKLTTDIMDEAAMAALGEAAPGELNSLEVTELRASVAGAELTGKGAFTFDNADTVTFQGMPAPTGALDLALTGGNGLLDKLTAMGLVPEDQVMGVRMMMGMFAVPATDGSDGLTTTIEFKDKMLMVNGNPMPM